MNGEHTKPVESLSEDHKSFAFPSEVPPACANGQDIPYGLTKRELFAAMAMQGAMHALAIQADEFEDDKPVDPHPIAKDAVRMADALLKELAK